MSVKLLAGSKALRFSSLMLAVWLLSVVHVGTVTAQQLPPPVHVNPLSVQYSSPYGPRFKDGRYQYHFGIDYLYGLGTPFYAVEAGSITDIKIDGSNDWYISVDGTHHFSYLHIFDNSWMASVEGGNLDATPTFLTDASGYQIFGQACLNGTAPPLLQGVSDQSCTNAGDLITLESTQCLDELAIIFWQDFDQNIATRVLSACVGGSDFVIGGIRPSRHVAQGDLLGAIGDSGVAAGHPHLHLQVDSGDHNPLLYVQHDNAVPPSSPLFDIELFKDSGSSIGELDLNKTALSAGNVLNPMRDSPLRVRTKVDYSGHGHDLEAVGIFMFKNSVPNPYQCTAAGGVAGPNGNGGVGAKCFGYGGNPMLQRSVFPFPPNRTPRAEDIDQAVEQGIYPQSRANVDFLTDGIDLTQTDPGSYLLAAAAQDVEGGQAQRELEVEVPPKVTVTIVGFGAVTSTPSGLNSGINNCGPGPTTCFDWFDIRDGVSLTATTSQSGHFQGWSGDCVGTDPTVLVFTGTETPESRDCTATFTPRSFTGNWNTTYGFMTLTQNGITVTGNYGGGFNGAIIGTVTTDINQNLILSATWRDVTGTGTLIFTQTSDDEFFGTWLRSTGAGNPGGAWNGIRDNGPTFTGRWSTDFGIMTLVQNGNVVTGTYDLRFGGFNGALSGTANGLVLTAFWADSTGTGNLVFQLTPDNQDFNGTWSRFSGTGDPGGTWDATRAP